MAKPPVKTSACFDFLVLRLRHMAGDIPASGAKDKPFSEPPLVKVNEAANSFRASKFTIRKTGKADYGRQRFRWAAAHLIVVFGP